MHQASIHSAGIIRGTACQRKTASFDIPSWFFYSLLLIVLNALSFGISHFFYGNWVAPVLSFFGGLLFAWRYQTSRSMRAVVIEHALWGDFLFTTGIGWYFYIGAIH